MPRWAKLLIGLAAALVAGWLYYGPYGGGARFIDALQQRAELRLSLPEVRGVGVTARMQREPLARLVTLSGPADPYQREGMGSYPGINDRMRTIPGMGGIAWQGEEGDWVLPLLAEILLLAAAAWLTGLGIGWLLFGRRRRQSFLGDEEFET
ncbi:MAG TPA: hypothetical protein VD887_09110 [Allosphingosinicella sp.]|nr:hypothetical protein [Allosphingosinicella sp.]